VPPTTVKATEPPQPTYVVGDDDDDFWGDDDDDDVIITPGGNTGNGNAADHDDNKVPGVQEDVEGQKSFLESVPKNLAGAKVEILVWYKPLDSQVAKMQRFEDATGIDIEFVYADEANYLNKLASMKASGNAPEIACIRPSDYPLSILQDYFLPLTDEDMALDPTVYDLDTMASLAWDGENYGFVAYKSTKTNYGLLLYNQDIFDQYGVTDPYTMWRNGNWNWDSFVTMAQDIQKKSGITALTAEYHGYLLSLTAGEDCVAMKNGKLVNNADSANLRNAYRWLNNLKTTGQYKILDQGLNSAGFIGQQAVMYVQSSWALQAGERYGDLPFTLGYAPLPSPKGMQTTVPATIQQWGYPVGSGDLEAAKYVMEWWMNPAFNNEDEPIWLNDSVASFMAEISQMPLNPLMSQGIIEFGGDYDWEMDYNFDVSGAGAANVDSALDSWKTVIETNLTKIYTEFKK
jgi:multiple sugar transport system substrate-binding protein